MTTRSVLVHLPGFPLEPMHLMPQRDLACAASALLDAGHWTRILDCGTVSAVGTFPPEGPAEYARKARIAGVVATFSALAPLDFAIFQVRTWSDFGEAMHAGIALRTLPSAPRLFLAGAFAAGHGGLSLLAAEAFDGVIKGPIAAAVAALAASCRASSGWSGVPSLVYREGRHVATTSRRPMGHGSTPGPCYDPAVYPALTDDQKILLFPVGPFSCASSPASGLGSAGWRARQLGAEGARRTREEMEDVVRAWGGAAFHLAGGTLNVAGQERVARELLEYGCCFPFSTFGQPRAGVRQIYPLLRQAGCEAVHFDVRTGSQRLQEDFYGSGYGMSRVEEHLHACKEAGILAHTALVYPCPHDDYHTSEETLRFLRRCRPETVSLGMPDLREGCDWWCHPGAFGFKVSQRAILRWLKAAGRGNLATPAPGTPYLMRGWTAGRILEAREQLRANMQRLGVMECGAVQAAMMARLTGYRGDEGAYDSVLSNLMRQGDARALRNLVSEFNARVMRPSEGLGFTVRRPALEAVGN